MQTVINSEESATKLCFFSGSADASGGLGGLGSAQRDQLVTENVSSS